ncbi:TPA: hypothetical protein RQN23_004509 [Aeromonas veronii]|nr:hypothetical protein [Aeromonas veronii]
MSYMENDFCPFMNHTFIDDAKKMAKKLRLRLGSFGICISYNQALEGIAASFGFDSWSALKASICPQTDEPQPTIDEHRRCPKCHAVASQPDEIARIFGYRTINGTIRPQSWCRSCRSGTFDTRDINHEKTD